MAGRKSKLSAKTRRLICDAVRDGASFRAAAAAAGVHETTLHAWRTIGEHEEDGPYRAFVRALEAAQLEGEAVACRQLFASFTEPTIETTVEELADGTTRTKTKTIPPDASMALRWLERRAPGRWNIPHRLAIGQDPDADPIVTYYLPDNGREDARAEDAPGGDEAVFRGALREA